ncbi:MAG TPA: hypothetical protein VNO22_05625 [Planctomycetota bacterium]|jgi:hypothetical protein|nr:hypothetical protein [Planctomycetota bacterium]
METLMALVLALSQGAPRAAQGQEEPPAPLPPGQDRAARPRPPAEPVFGGRAGIDLTYNSNILRLDDRDVERLEDGTRPDKFRIEQPDDFIVSPWAEGSMEFSLLDAPATAGLRARAHLYQANSIANYEELTLFLRRAPAEISYTFMPDVYRREYRNLDTGEFESAFYRDHLFEAEVRTRPWQAVTVRPKACLEFRDYDAPFNHRDSIFYGLGARAGVDVLRDVELLLEYEFVLNDSFARSFQPDVSYQEHALEPGVAVRPLRGVELKASYRFADRRYTTDNRPAVDPGHADREDDRRRASLGARWRVSSAVTLEAEARFTRVDISLPHDPGATDEETSWNREEYVLGFTYRF